MFNAALLSQHCLPDAPDEKLSSEKQLSSWTPWRLLSYSVPLSSILGTRAKLHSLWRRLEWAVWGRGASCALRLIAHNLPSFPLLL